MKILLKIKGIYKLVEFDSIFHNGFNRNNKQMLIIDNQISVKNYDGYYLIESIKEMLSKGYNENNQLELKKIYDFVFGENCDIIKSNQNGFIEVHEKRKHKLKNVSLYYNGNKIDGFDKNSSIESIHNPYIVFNTFDGKNFKFVFYNYVQNYKIKDFIQGKNEDFFWWKINNGFHLVQTGQKLVIFNSSIIYENINDVNVYNFLLDFCKLYNLNIFQYNELAHNGLYKANVGDLYLSTNKKIYAVNQGNLIEKIDNDIIKISNEYFNANFNFSNDIFEIHKSKNLIKLKQNVSLYPFAFLYYIKEFGFDFELYIDNHYQKDMINNIHKLGQLTSVDFLKEFEKLKFKKIEVINDTLLAKTESKTYCFNSKETIYYNEYRIVDDYLLLMENDSICVYNKDFEFLKKYDDVTNLRDFKLDKRSLIIG